MTRRRLVFLFGVLSYLIFLIVILYAICFTGNLFITKSIDGNVQSSLAIAAFIDVLLIALFGVQHSLMARSAFKGWLARWIPEPVNRSVFVLCASLTLILLFWQWRPIGGFVWNISGGWLHLGLEALFWVGWGMVILSTFLIDHFDLFGLRQVYLYLRGATYTPVGFKEPVVYKYVRHPLMLSILIAFWSTPQMSFGHFLFASGMTVYILMGIHYEEKDLLASYGETYRRYRHQVAMLLPWRKQPLSRQ
jgi:protein-S-isoprenylcysteine O-methyltransferase Ste14